MILGKIVGCHGIGKHELAKALVGVGTSYALQVRTATSLPLPENKETDRPKIDMVIFMIDMTDKRSMAVVESSLPHLDVDYFLGRVCFVIKNAQGLLDRSVEIEAVTQLADTYDSPLLCETVEPGQGGSSVAEKILQLLAISVGFHDHITPLLIDVTKRPYHTLLDSSIAWTPNS
ncbi:centromere protein M-like [Lingula anatina]|uniref:Centromere protein M n=1 Tax=Lingula anatina TaxID=7574 RepID=A0A1S3IXW1_LINAN|nr:centromere protein M-like [Lingula anatina]|eukprot:XP_013402384.1 centromere protein M-like [Lingula anatina]